MNVELPDASGLSTSQAARRFIECGIGIVVYDPRIGNGKVCGTLVGGGSKPWYQHVTTDRNVIDGWRQRFGSFNRLALATSPGAYGAVVLDVDQPEKVAADWWPLLKTAPFVATRPNGVKRRGHYWFAHPEPLANKPYPWGEVRSVGGGIVLPPHPDGRRIERSGPLQGLPERIRVAVAEAGVAASVSLDAFLTRYVDQTKPYKLRGLENMLRAEVIKTGSRHDAAKTALLVGFGEARIGYVSARNVYETIRLHWTKGERELRALAAWAASVADTPDPKEIKAHSDRLNGTDSRQYAHL